jgi:formate/nitrite transporter FocA (FNT family)
MDHMSAQETMASVRQVARQKASLPTTQMLLRGALAGGLLGYATSLVMVILSQGLPPIVGALCFPVGFVMLVLLGLELATGNFALLPVALMSRAIGWSSRATGRGSMWATFWAAWRTRCSSTSPSRTSVHRRAAPSPIK